MSVLMALGPHRFQTEGPSYERFEQSFAGRWSGVELIGREPAQHFMGPGEVTVSLEGVVYPFVFKGFREIEELEKEPAKGRALVLVSGFGKVFGRFGVKQVTRRESMIFIKGAPQKIEFTIELVRVPRSTAAASILSSLQGLF